MFLPGAKSPWFPKKKKRRKKITTQWLEIFQFEGHSYTVGLNFSISFSAAVSIKYYWAL